MFVISHVLFYFLTSSTKMFPYSITLSFLIIASIRIPAGWVLAQALIRVFFYLDLGALTCGLKYRFGNFKSLQKLYNVYVYCYKGNSTGDEKREVDDGQEVELSLKDSYPDGEVDVAKEEENDLGLEVDLQEEKIVPVNRNKQEENVMKKEDMQEKFSLVNEEESTESEEDLHDSIYCARTTCESSQVQFEAKTGR